MAGTVGEIAKAGTQVRDLRTWSFDLPIAEGIRTHLSLVFAAAVVLTSEQMKIVPCTEVLTCRVARLYLEPFPVLVKGETS